MRKNAKLTERFLPLIGKRKTKSGRDPCAHARPGFRNGYVPSSLNRILIAEDHYVSRHLLDRNLGNWGFEVTAAEDGQAALEILLGDDPPAIAVLDWMMPKMDGVEVCIRVRAAENRPYVYLLLLTAKSQKEEIALGLDAGADDYVIKPFDPDELRARLKVGQRVVNLERHLAKQVRDLEGALSEVNRLRDLLPICMYCKSIRDDNQYWHSIEEYFHAETGADFSHGICPVCMEKLTQEITASAPR